MPDVQKCPHCYKEITENNVKNEVLFQQFRETEVCRSLEKKGDLWFFGGVALIILAVLMPLFYESEPALMGLPSLTGLIILLCGVVAGFSVMAIGYKYQSKKDKLFQEFKKLRE